MNTPKCMNCIYAEFRFGDIICHHQFHPGRVAKQCQNGSFKAVSGCEWCYYCHSYSPLHDGDLTNSYKIS